jgi:tetratricopeptide (TPR) repeat protein
MSSDILVEARRLLDQGRFADARNELAKVEQTDSAYGYAVEWTARAWIEQGSMRDAAQLLRGAILLQLPEPASSRCRLWLAYTQLYGDAESTPMCSWEVLQAVAEHAKVAPDLPTRALAIDLRGRMAALRVALERDPPTYRRHSIELMERAVEAYQSAGEHGEAVRARLRLSHTCKPLPYGDPVRARQALEQAAASAAAIKYRVGEADARLSMAETDLDHFLATCDADANLSAWVETFETVATLYRDAEHAFGEAKTRWIFASVLLKYGYPQAVEIAREAAFALSAADETIIQQDVWKTLHMWHTLHGSPIHGREARERSEALSQKMAFPLAAGVDQLAFADEALRAGRYGEAERRLLTVIQESAFRDVHVPAKLVLANVLSRANRTEEAIATISTVIEDLERAGGSRFLQDALLIRANFTFDTAPHDADQDFQRLLELDRTNADAVAQAQHRITWAWARVDFNRRSKRSPIVTPEVEAEFDMAEATLLPLRSFEAQKQLGSLHQQRGQVAFVAGQWEQCGRSLNAAEHVFRTLGLWPDLAFTLIFQGLVLVHLGREKGPGLYREARERFMEAERLYRESGLSGMLWNAIFYRGICDREQGSYWELPGSSEQHNHWAAAESLFLQASRVIDVQRGSLNGESDRSAQLARAGFARDKQEVYREGFQLAAHLRRNTTSAVQWLERMKGWAVLDALASAPLVLYGSRKPHPLISRNEELRQRKRDVATFAEADSIQREIDDNLERLEAAPETAGYAALRRAYPPCWAIVRAALQAEEARRSGRRVVIAQFHHGARPLLFGMRTDWDAPRMAPLAVNSAQLNEFAEFCFGDGNGGARMKNDRLDNEWAGFAPLIAPLAEWTEPQDTVVLIPHKELHNLPLHILPIGDTTLGDRNPVTYVPSLSVLYHLLNRQRGASTATRLVRAATFGDPTEDRQHIRSAVVAAAKTDSFNSEPRLGPEVTRERLLAGLEQSDHFLYAGHGQFEAADGMRSGLRLANGVRVTASDIFGLSHTAALVVLGGCVTGVQERRVGDELLGMVQALLLKGANGVVASQWKVPDAATGVLVQMLAQEVSEHASATHALQAACRMIRAKKEQGHPYYWGGFVVFGLD